MRRTAAALALACLAAASLASAATAPAVATDSIVRIKLGMSRAKATALLAKPVRFDRLEDRYQRLVSGATKVEVYFRTGSQGVVAVTTWNRALRTDKRIGPCSTVAALKRAYGAHLRPVRQAGKVVAYRLGDLIFTTEGRPRLGVVALGRGTAATYVALNAPECR